MKKLSLLLLLNLTFIASFSQKSNETPFYKYSYGGSLGYYFLSGFGVNLNAQYNINKYISVGGVLYMARPDAVFYNYLGQSQIALQKNVNSYSMRSSGALLRMELNVINTKIIGLYGALAFGLGHSSYKINTELTYYDNFYPYNSYQVPITQTGSGFHYNYSVDAGLKIKANEHLNIFGEMGFGTAFMKLGATWNM